MRKWSIAAAGVLAMVAGAQAQTLTGPAKAAHQRMTAAIEANPNLTQTPNTVLVQFAGGMQDAGVAAALGAVKGTVIWSYSLVPGLRAIEVGVPAAQAIAILNATPGVVYAEPDFIVRHTGVPNDTNFGVQWGCHNTGQTIQGVVGVPDADIDAPEAWDTFTGDPNFVVAIIDTGSQWNHPDLSANMWTNAGEIAGNGLDDDANGFVDDIRGWDFFSNDNDPNDSDGHGTHTAGTVGARGNNAAGVAGVCWNARLMPLRFLGPTGGSTSGAIAALNYAVAKGVKVSNNSWGGGGFSQSLLNAINASQSVGHVFVAAAGNNGTNNDVSPFYPAAYNSANLIAVASTTNTDARSSFSNYGATTVDIGGPGSSIASTYLNSGYAYLSGTSMACPHVAGVTALVYGQNPSWTWSQVRTQVLSTARPIAALNGLCVTGGVVNAAAALGGGGPINTAPSVTISSPSSGSSFVQGTNVTFTGSATDAEDGNISSSLNWTSNLQGAIGSGGSFATTSLVVGTHTITASVTDSGGLSGQAQVAVTITSNAPTIPAAPSNLNATAAGPGVANLTWSDNSNNETGFEIQRQRRVGGTWTQTTTINAGANTTQLQNAPGSGRFRYRIRAVNAAGASAWTGWRQIQL